MKKSINAIFESKGDMVNFFNKHNIQKEDIVSIETHVMLGVVSVTLFGDEELEKAINRHYDRIKRMEKIDNRESMIIFGIFFYQNMKK